jgi:hypothetical protein
MRDIVERLRAWHTPGETITGDVQLYLDAADEIERMRKELDDVVEASDAKLASLAPHGSCGCSYDRPGDVCMHHSPQLSEARARVRDLEEALRGEWLTIDSAPRDHALPAIWVADLDGCMEPVRWRWRTWKNIYTDTDIGFEPTHWCPTPSLPGALREGGNG